MKCEGVCCVQAVKRLGGGKSQLASDRWKKQKKKQGSSSEQQQQDDSGMDREGLDRLTGLADQLVATGDYCIHYYRGHNYSSLISGVSQPFYGNVLSFSFC